MKNRIIGAVAAGLLALLGTVLLVGYVDGAEQRAFAGTQTENVLVLSATVPAGTPAEDALLSTTTEAMPAKAIAEGVVTDPAQIAGLVTTVDLVPGEQLLVSRFIDPADAAGPTEIEVPEGMQEVSVLLEPQRMAGGRLSPGDTVGVFISLGAGTLQPPAPVTHLTMHKVLVTAIQGLPAEVEGEVADDASGVPAGSLIVTLARTAPDVEKLVFAQEFGTLWLSKEPSEATEDGTRELTQEGIYR
ncbi:Flp pilus assembly protein CpaB [Arthrobacter sp. L77]|uniref:Flp pilus assembly protein CpaB n=1 Tax=Arthrobacter sp. L77 TaxID=1496689 RepID=UPI0005BE4F43|nr:Flp pilus assembly protein CpaB [Arthrobacter sp. L77]